MGRLVMRSVAALFAFCLVTAASALSVDSISMNFANPGPFIQDAATGRYYVHQDDKVGMTIGLTTGTGDYLFGIRIINDATGQIEYTSELIYPDHYTQVFFTFDRRFLASGGAPGDYRVVASASRDGEARDKQLLINFGTGILPPLRVGEITGTFMTPFDMKTGTFTIGVPQPLFHPFPTNGSLDIRFAWSGSSSPVAIAWEFLDDATRLQSIASWPGMPADSEFTPTGVIGTSNFFTGRSDYPREDIFIRATVSQDGVSVVRVVRLLFAVTAPPADTTPPVLTLPGDLIEEATSAAGAAVSFSVSADDAVDGSLSVDLDHASGSIFPLGTTTVTASATDAAGNTATGTFSVTVQDTTPPVVACALAKDLMNKNDRSLVNVGYSQTASDTVSSTLATVITVFQDEPTGNAADATVTVAPGTPVVKLRDERSNKDDGRVYRIQVVVSDEAGNATTKVLTAVAPRDPSKAKLALVRAQAAAAVLDPSLCPEDSTIATPAEPFAAN